MSTEPESGTRGGRGAALVAAGILLSRLFGLARQKLFAHYLGNGLEAAAWAAATRIPNVLQNLLGEGVLSASFIPVYAGLRAKGDEAGARRVAGAVFGLLAVLVSLLVLVGVLAAPLLVALVAPGYEGEARALTVRLVRLIFPGTGVLVLSAWCLGILNSHRRFFLSYAAPVVWNGCIIAALLIFRGETQERLVTWAAWGNVIGSVAQFLVQVPPVLRLLGRFDARPSLELPAVRTVVKGFGPAVAARGVVQVSAWVDTAYASLISERAVAALSYAQTIALLPISLFGMAISAAELPAMSEAAASPEGARVEALKTRLGAGLGRLAFFVVPSAVGFLTAGDLIAAVLLESGAFTAADSRFAWYILMGSAVALWAQTSGRLYSSAFYALGDTKTPLRFAALRVGLGVAVGYYAVRVLPGQLGLPAHLGAVFITVTTGVTAWLEMTLLRRSLGHRLGGVPGVGPRLRRVLAAAVVAGVGVLAVKAWLVSVWGARAQAAAEWGGGVLPPPALPVFGTSVALLLCFGALYGAACLALRVPEATALVRRVLRRR